MGPREWFGALPGSDPFAELEIRDEDNRPVPVGAEGEIAIRCEGQMTGLWDEPYWTGQDRRVAGS
jgi:acyl-coenzyme A synthetase/AMP-(fatty) acid ligase